MFYPGVLRDGRHGLPLVGVENFSPLGIFCHVRLQGHQMPDSVVDSQMPMQVRLNVCSAVDAVIREFLHEFWGQPTVLEAPSKRGIMMSHARQVN